MRMQNFGHALCVAAAALAVSACSDNETLFNNPSTLPTTGAVPAGLPVTAFALSTDNRLSSFNPSTLTAVTAPTAVTGLVAGDTLLGMDVRPADGGIYAIGKNGTTGNLYTIDPTTSVATRIPGALSLTDNAYGVDWNPAANALRVVGNGGQNLRLAAIVAGPAGSYVVNADTSTTPSSGVIASAYTNSFSNVAATTLYNITSSESLVSQGAIDGTNANAGSNPNLGVLTTIGGLGVTSLSTEAGFDVDGLSGVALAALNRSGTGSSQLCSVNLGVGTVSCYGTIPGNIVARDIALPRVQPAVAFAVTSLGSLVSFAPNTAGVAAPTTVAPVTGLAGGETVVGMDFRPADGLLYAVTNQGRVYTINQTTAVATAPSGGTQFAFSSGALAGTAFGVDFNPVPDRIRAVTNADENFRLNPVTGLAVDGDTVTAGTQMDGALNPSGDAVAAAYTSNFAGAASTTLFVLDSSGDNLLRQGSIGGAPVSPNGGALTAIGGLGVDALDTVASFDIIGGPGVSAAGANTGDSIAYAVLSTTAGTSVLHRINLGTGAAASVGTVVLGAGVQASAFAVKLTR